jgi:CubicO group peptidase (beta-lactamase class C family)
MRAACVFYPNARRLSGRCSAVLAAVLFAAAVPNHAAVPTKDQQVLQLQDRMRAVMQMHGVPGAAAVYVPADGKPRIVTLGIRDMRTEKPVTAQTLFRLGSISKSFTGLAAALLVIDGKLNLDWPIATWFPALPNAAGQIGSVTVKQLLTHTTGLNLGALDLFLWPQPNSYDAGDLMRGLGDLALPVPATNTFAYSNGAYAIAAQIIAKVSGLPFEVYVQQEVFAPLKMTACTFGGYRVSRGLDVAAPHRIERGATHVIRADRGRVPVGLDAAPAGARCSINDLARWLEFLKQPAALAQERLLAARALATRTDVMVKSSDNAAARELTNYGLGFERQSLGSVDRLFHFGGVTGMQAYYEVQMQNNSGFAVVINAASATARAALIEVLRTPLALSAPAAVPSTAVVDASPEQTRRQLVRHVTAQEALRWRARYDASWLGEIEILQTKSGLGLRVSKSPRLTADIMHIGLDSRLAVLWHDPAVNSDVYLDPVHADGKQVKAFRLTPIDATDFDFRYVTAARVVPYHSRPAK